MDLLGSWQPTATIEQLTQNAAIVRLVREYMQEQGVLEVITPSLSRFTTTDPNIESVAACVMGDTRYLHTSPEFPMKRLLAAYQTSIYQITKVFRDGEVGARHNTEFSMLEWYRVGYSMEDLMNEVEQLLQHIFGSLDQPLESSNTVSYVSTVQTLLDCSFESVTTAKIRSYFHDHSRSFPESIDDVDSALDLLLDEFVIPGFASNRLTFVVEYPASQAALARVKKNRDGIEIALRFEAFLGTNELANGFYELADGAEQLRRFEQDNVRRQSRGQTPMPIDRALIEALNAEFPECSGVAMGLERVFMAVSGAAHIQQVQSFGAHNA